MGEMRIHTAAPPSPPVSSRRMLDGVTAPVMVYADALKACAAFRSWAVVTIRTGHPGPAARVGGVRRFVCGVVRADYHRHRRHHRPLHQLPQVTVRPAGGVRDSERGVRDCGICEIPAGRYIAAFEEGAAAQTRPFGGHWEL